MITRGSIDLNLVNGKTSARRRIDDASTMRRRTIDVGTGNREQGKEGGGRVDRRSTFHAHARDPPKTMTNQIGPKQTGTLGMKDHQHRTTGSTPPPLPWGEKKNWEETT